MARVIGVQVEHDVIGAAPVEDVALGVVIPFRLVTEDATLGFGVLDVADAPGRPNSFHADSLLSILAKRARGVKELPPLQGFTRRLNNLPPHVKTELKGGAVSWYKGVSGEAPERKTFPPGNRGVFIAALWRGWYNEKTLFPVSGGVISQARKKATASPPAMTSRSRHTSRSPRPAAKPQSPPNRRSPRNANRSS